MIIHEKTVTMTPDEIAELHLSEYQIGRFEQVLLMSGYEFVIEPSKIDQVNRSMDTSGEQQTWKELPVAV